MNTATGAATIATTTSTTIRAFWPTIDTQLGTSSATPAAGANSGCYDDTTGAALGGGTFPTDRLVWKSGGTDYNADNGTVSATLMMNLDFVLATTYQNSWSGSTTTARVTANYCDKLIQNLTTTTKTVTITTT